MQEVKIHHDVIKYGIDLSSSDEQFWFYSIEANPVPRGIMEVHRSCVVTNQVATIADDTKRFEHNHRKRRRIQNLVNDQY